MARKPMIKIFCDFCEKEIEKSTPVVGGEVTVKDAQGVIQVIDVEVRLGSPEPKKRFPFDICTVCVFDAAVEQLKAEFGNADMSSHEADAEA
jgi:hypothetical protein